MFTSMMGKGGIIYPNMSLYSTWGTTVNGLSPPNTTHTDKAIGAASLDRIIVVNTCDIRITEEGVSSIIIDDGPSMNVIGFGSYGPVSNYYMVTTQFYYPWPNGTTATFRVNHGTNIAYSIRVHSIYGAPGGGGAPYDSHYPTNPTLGTLTVPLSEQTGGVTIHNHGMNMDAPGSQLVGGTILLYDHHPDTRRSLAGSYHYPISDGTHNSYFYPQSTGQNLGCSCSATWRKIPDTK
jgi:hypothetical protein